MIKKTHYDQIDALKGFAILLVLLGHSIIVYPINLHDNPICLTVFDLVSTVHMPLFFTIAGLNYNYKSNSYKEYINKKIRRLMIPYLSFNLLEIIPRLLLSNFINKNISIKEFIFNIFFYGGNHWFLYVLFMILSIFPLISRISNSNIYNIILAFISIFITKIIILPQLFCINLFFKYFIFFILGYLVKKNYEIYKKKNVSKLSLIIVMGLWIFAFIISGKTKVRFYEIITSLLGILFSYLLFYQESLVDLFKKYGVYSLEMYLLSGFILVASRTFICHFTSNPFIIIVFNMLSTTLISFYVTNLLKNNKVFKLIVGEV